LVRPSPSARALAAFNSGAARASGFLLTSRTPAPRTPLEDSHAESLYFQKQIQDQTRMVVVLVDGERLEGVLEWYDRNAIKLRNGGRLRTLIYKSCIKYLYKAAEVAPPAIMQ
jgi:sRNA-binding regulator protein Hfq